MFTRSDTQIEKFFKDRQWVVPGEVNDNVSFDTLYAHYYKWTRAKNLNFVAADHFFTVCAVAHTHRLGLIRIQSAGIVLFAQIGLLMQGKVVDPDLWQDFDHEQALVDFVNDTSFCVLGPKKRIRRARFFKLYSEWCQSRAYPVFGKIKLFETLTTSTRLQDLDVKVGTMHGKTFVVRGIDEVGEL